MNTHLIERGDKVIVNFNNSQYTLTSHGIVHYTPCQPGDSWILQEEGEDTMYYISEPCTVTLYEKGTGIL